MENLPNSAMIAESLYTNIKTMISTATSQLRVATFCRVIKVELDKKLLCAQPIIREEMKFTTGNAFVQLPELINVPYYTGAFYYTDEHGNDIRCEVKPKVGDFCVCIHLDRCIDKFLNDTTQQFADSNKNRHNIGDSVAFVGFL